MPSPLDPRIEADHVQRAAKLLTDGIAMMLAETKGDNGELQIPMMPALPVLRTILLLEDWRDQEDMDPRTMLMLTELADGLRVSMAYMAVATATLTETVSAGYTREWTPQTLWAQRWNAERLVKTFGQPRSAIVLNETPAQDEPTTEGNDQ